MTAPTDVSDRGCLRLAAPGRSRRHSPPHRPPSVARHSGLVLRFVLGSRLLSESVLRDLEAEQQAHRAADGEPDLLLLPSVREGKKHFLSEKVLAWFLWAVANFPNAAFIGKADMDTTLVWERARVHLLHAEEWGAREARFVMVGALQWVSFHAGARSFCGCCGVNEGHGKSLQTDLKAFFGPCSRFAPNRSSYSSETVIPGGHHSMSLTHGPYPFAQGAFYAWNAPLVRWLASEHGGMPLVTQLREALERWPPNQPGPDFRPWPSPSPSPKPGGTREAAAQSRGPHDVLLGVPRTE